MNEILSVVEEADDGSLRASAVGASIHTEAETLEEPQQEIRDAVRCHFDEGQQHLTIPAHNPLRPGTLQHILKDVAAQIGTSLDQVVASLE